VRPCSLNEFVELVRAVLISGPEGAVGGGLKIPRLNPPLVYLEKPLHRVANDLSTVPILLNKQPEGVCPLRGDGPRPDVSVFQPPVQTTWQPLVAPKLAEDVIPSLPSPIARVVVPQGGMIVGQGFRLPSQILHQPLYPGRKRRFSGADPTLGRGELGRRKGG
jgi:hypothetical protein